MYDNIKYEIVCMWCGIILWVEYAMQYHVLYVSECIVYEWMYCMWVNVLYVSECIVCEWMYCIWVQYYEYPGMSTLLNILVQ